MQQIDWKFTIDFWKIISFSSSTFSLWNFRFSKFSIQMKKNYITNSILSWLSINIIRKHTTKIFVSIDFLKNKTWSTIIVDISKKIKIWKLKYFLNYIFMKSNIFVKKKIFISKFFFKNAQYKLNWNVSHFRDDHYWTT